VLVGLFGWGLLVGCSAQTDHLDDRDWTKEHGLQSGAYREAETLFTEAEADVDNIKHTLRGVRHDLTLAASGSPDARCRCLEVAIGNPRDPRFTWASDPPTIDPDNMVVVLRSAGTDCGDSHRRPSIQAVEVSASDVVVVIEELGFERPQALGAVILKPGRDGGLWVRAANKKLPYARSSAGRDACRVPTDPARHHRQIRAGRRF
jgi:hypothetical protein